MSLQNDNQQYSVNNDSEKNKNYPEGQHPGQNSFLLAFDFDHTICSDNSDCVITSLVKCPVPEEIKKFYNGTNWTEYMNQVFKFLHDQGVSIGDICKCIRAMEPTKGMLPLLTFLVQLKTACLEVAGTTDNRNNDLSISSTCPMDFSSLPQIHLLIISDANDLFISEFLKANVLDPITSNLNGSATCHPFPFDIITNKSVVLSNDNEAALTISPFEFQTACKICPKNLCKGLAIQNYIQSKGPFTRVFYTGDGRNDVCPALKLSQNDFVFVRKNYAMHKMVQKSPNYLGISANLMFWDDAESIQSTIKEYVQKKL